MAYSNDNINGYRPDEDDELWDDDIDLKDAPDTLGVEPSESTDDSEISGSADGGARGEDLGGDSDLKASVPEPEKPRRRRFSFGPATEEDDNDFYDSESEQDPEPKKEKKTPILDPENPDYWIEDEPEIPSILPSGRSRWKWWLAAVAIFIVMIAAAWIWMFNPYVDGAVKYGYLKHMERRGTVVKTFEGELIPYREISEHTPVYMEDFRFSVADDSTAAKMKRMMLECIPVRMEYKVYHTSLPWRGDEKVVVVRADSADVDKILPPEFRLPGEGKK